MSEQNRVPGGAPGAPKGDGGQFAGTARTDNAVALTGAPLPTTTEVALDAALGRKAKADEDVVTLTLAAVAHQVLQLRSDAVYLTLDEAHEYGAHVVAGTVLDADFQVIADDLSELSDRKTAGEVDLLLHRVAGLKSTDACPAISDRFADDHAWSATGERRLDLQAAVHLAPKDTSVADEAVKAALHDAGKAPTFEKATQILSAALTEYLTAPDPDRPITGWVLERDTDNRQEDRYSSTLTVSFADEDEDFDLDGTAGADLIDALSENVSVQREVPTIRWQAPPA